jgi:hypothetical protein
MREARQLWAGAAVLLLGCAVYACERSPGDAWLMPNWASLPALRGLLPTPLAGSLPTFCHVFAFALFTATCLPPARVSAVAASAVWLAIDGLFELAQHPTLQAVLIPWLGRNDNPLNRVVALYVARGTFDVGDLLAAVGGAMAACVMTWRN